MFRTALISSGFTIKDPTNYANNINRLIALGLDIDLDEWITSQTGTKEDDTKEDDTKENDTKVDDNKADDNSDGEMEEMD